MMAVEYYHWQNPYMLEGRWTSAAKGMIKKSSLSKAAAFLTRGAYAQYVSTAKWRERRWRLFPTFPCYLWQSATSPCTSHPYKSLDI